MGKVKNQAADRQTSNPKKSPHFTQYCTQRHTETVEFKILFIDLIIQIISETTDHKQQIKKIPQISQKKLHATNPHK